MKNISTAPKSLVPLSQSLSDLSPQHHYSTFLSSSFVFSRRSVSGCLTNLAQCFEVHLCCYMCQQSNEGFKNHLRCYLEIAQK